MNRRKLLNILGAALLLTWALWWVASLQRNYLLFGATTWIPAWPFLGVDFQYSFLAVHHWLAGGNPYREFFGDARGLYAYPPLVLALFAWSGGADQRTATVVWFLISSAILGRMAWVIARRRGISPPLAAAVVLFSTPVLFALERGNCDVIPLLLIALAAWTMKRKTILADFLAGTFLAMAMWTKIYPGLAVLGTLPLRRWRVFTWAAAMGLLIGLVPLSATRDFFHDEAFRSKFIVSAVNLQNDPTRAESGLLYYPPLETFSHSVPIYWKTFWDDAPTLARLPGVIGAGLLLAPMIIALSWKLWRSPGRNAVTFVYLAWLALVGTFWMPVSYDYNLIYLPILILALASFRDGILPLLLLAPVLLYLQPFQFPVLMPLLLLFKLLTLPALAICIAHRAGEAAQRKVAL